jgi:hypothetical protein
LGPLDPEKEDKRGGGVHVRAKNTLINVCKKWASLSMLFIGHLGKYKTEDTAIGHDCHKANMFVYQNTVA